MMRCLVVQALALKAPWITRCLRKRDDCPSHFLSVELRTLGVNPTSILINREEQINGVRSTRLPSSVLQIVPYLRQARKLYIF